MVEKELVLGERGEMFRIRQVLQCSPVYLTLGISKPVQLYKW